MTMDEIINYVMNSPENSNPNVLRSMLSQIEGGKSSIDIELVEFHFNMINEYQIQLDKTWQELYDAFQRKAIIYDQLDEYNRIFIVDVVSEEQMAFYGIKLVGKSETIIFTTDSPSGYPMIDNTPTEDNNDLIVS